MHPIVYALGETKLATKHSPNYFATTIMWAVGYEVMSQTDNPGAHGKVIVILLFYASRALGVNMCY